MAYGFEVRDANGNIIIDDRFPMLMATGEKGTYNLGHVFEGTMSYVDYAVGAPTTFTGNIYKHETSDTRAAGEFRFFEVPTGHRVHAMELSNRIDIWSTSPTIRYVKCKFQRYLTAPTGSYGIAVFDDAGRCTYHSDHRLCSIVGTLQTPKSGAWVSFGGYAVRRPTGSMFLTGASRSAGGVLTAQGLRPGSWYQSAETGTYDSDSQRVRVIVANINYALI